MRRLVGAPCLGGLIEGAYFAAAYYSIWLGANPLDRPLRNQLLECS